MLCRMHTLGLLLVCVSISLSSVVFADEAVGEITGRVTDTEGENLPGTQITLTGDAISGAKIAVVGANGRYRFPLLPVGTYSAVASIDGFQSDKKQGLHVPANGTLYVAFTLRADGQ